MLASGALRRELEEAEQVRVPRPSPRFLLAPEPAGAAPALPPSSLLKVGAGLSEMERQIQESRTALEKDVKALSELLARLGKEDPRLGPDPLGPGGPSGISL